MSIRYDHPRSAWTSKATRSHRFNTRVLGAYLHWPGPPETSLHGETTAQIAARLRGYRDDHVNRRRWKDIAYGAAVDWRGRTWELRGLDRESGANGGTVSNNHGAAILLLLGAREVPTQAMIDGVLRLLAQLKATYPTASWVRGHQQSPEAGGQCPGPAVMGLLRAGRFHYRGGAAASVPSPGASAPAVTKTGRLKVDGRAGVETIKALQRFLNRAVKAGLKVDGRAGEATWTALQQYLGAPYKDGRISRQSYRPRELGNGIVDRSSAWEYTGRGSKGSQTVELLQRKIGAAADGIWGEGTSAALQRWLNKQG